MSSFNIWVTEKCNLCCTYCYETSKRTLSMSDETIGKTIAFIRKNFQINDYNMINFHGGEPLIAADIILRIVSECNSMGRFCYSLTTNGLLLNEDLAKKLIDSRIYISLSLDGTKYLST